jgi:hypothetical protein
MKVMGTQLLSRNVMMEEVVVGVKRKIAVKGSRMGNQTPRI